MAQDSKKKPRYRNLILLFFLYIIFWVVLIAILQRLFRPPSGLALSRWIPLNNVFIELGLIFVLILPISAIIGLVVGGYLITPLILFIHKKILGSKKFYGIQSEPSSEEGKLLSRGFFPVLMAINLSSIFLNPAVLKLILAADILLEFDEVAKIPILTKFLAELILLMITFGVATTFFSSVWFLKDSGIIYSNKQKVVKSDESLVVRSIGDWYQTILRSYAGIGAVITYISVIQDFVTRFINIYGQPGYMFNIPSLILWLGMPFYLILSLIPAIIFADLIKKNRISYIRNIGRKIGIKESAIISLEFSGEP